MLETSRSDIYTVTLDTLPSVAARARLSSFYAAVFNANTIAQIESVQQDTHRAQEVREQAPLVSVLLGILQGWIKAATPGYEPGKGDLGMYIEFLYQMSIRLVEKYKDLLDETYDGNN